MELSSGHIAFMVVGIIAGGLTAWFILKGKLALADANGRSIGEVERTSLSEKLISASREVADLKARLSETDRHQQNLQAELSKAHQECAQLAERAKRLIDVENQQKEATALSDRLSKDVSDLRELNGRLTASCDGSEKRVAGLDESNRSLSSERDSLFAERARLNASIAELNTTLTMERTQTIKDLALINEAREQLSNQFETLANKILDEKSKKFTDQNQINLSQLLNPLQERIKAFQAKVEEVYVNEGKDRSALAEQVKMLTQLNSTLSQDTHNLTLALKGDRKAQGNWGEIILDDVLEKAGLLRGQHYERQGSIKTEDGQTHVIPDVVVNLPNDRYLVIDSKMTLPDYRAFASAESEDDRTSALKRHLVSIRAHIKGLSEKNYQTLYELKSLDFVVMFIPLEPAFMLAVTNDPELFQHAWERNVLLVSPSTLLFVVRTVAYLWRQEGLSRNAKDISNRGAELYDKLVGFVTDLQKVGERIQQAQDSYNDARRKLNEGPGNVIRQAEMLKKLGVKPNKVLPTQWVEPALDEPYQAFRSEQD